MDFAFFIECAHMTQWLCVLSLSLCLCALGFLTENLYKQMIGVMKAHLI